MLCNARKTNKQTNSVLKLIKPLISLHKTKYLTHRFFCTKLKLSSALPVQSTNLLLILIGKYIVTGQETYKTAILQLSRPRYFFILCWPCISVRLLLTTNLTHFLQCIYLFYLPTCFEQHSVHHQEINCINTSSGTYYSM